MSFETEGTVHKVFDTENKTASFQAREFVIKQEGIYPQFIKFQLTQDRCDLVNNYKEGDTVKVFFDLRGREWNEKYFTNLNAWKVEKVELQAENAAPTPAEGPPSGFEPIEDKADGSSDLTAEDFEGLPF